MFIAAVLDTTDDARHFYNISSLRDDELDFCQSFSDWYLIADGSGDFVNQSQVAESDFGYQTL